MKARPRTTKVPAPATTPEDVIERIVAALPEHERELVRALAARRWAIVTGTAGSPSLLDDVVAHCEALARRRSGAFGRCGCWPCVQRDADALAAALPREAPTT